MRIVTVQITGLSPYSQSRLHETPKLPKETHDAYEHRTWREKCTVCQATGRLRVPPMALKMALPVAARKLGKQIPGRGKSTYTKFFEADVICTATSPLDVHKDEVASIAIWANSDGVRGSGKRVKRIFPVVDDWSCEAEFLITDDTVTPEVFEEVLTAAGQGVGIGRFRPENGGVNGRFRPDRFDWQ